MSTILYSNVTVSWWPVFSLLWEMWRNQKTTSICSHYHFYLLECAPKHLPSLLLQGWNVHARDIGQDLCKSKYPLIKNRNQHQNIDNGFLLVREIQFFVFRFIWIFVHNTSTSFIIRRKRNDNNCHWTYKEKILRKNIFQVTEDKTRLQNNYC